MKKLPALCLGLCFLFPSLAGCSSNTNDITGEIALPHYDQISQDGSYNRNLFYRNDLVSHAADPSVVYITDGAEKGYFYMYATSDDIGASGYQSWKSKDLVNWECMGVAFVPDRNSWARQNYWAPEVVHYKNQDEEVGKYYMFYNAWNVNKDNMHCLGLAVSDTPNGPFKQYTGKSGNLNLTINDSFIDSSLFPEGSKVKNQPLIDASPFIDDNGDIYLYFVHDIQMGAQNSSIYGMKMKDMTTPDYSSVKQITEFGKKTVGGSASIQDRNKTNEAPFMIKHNGKYYMTYSTSQYFFADYSVCQAIADSPLGNFEKVDYDKGGRFLSYEGVNGEENYDHMSGTGHHSFVKVGNEIFAIYHAFVDRYAGTIGMGRAIAADRVTFVNNGEKEIIYSLGPTYSMQPLPQDVSGYVNIAPKADITATNIIVGNGTEYLNDNIFKTHNYSFIKEFKTSKGSAITLTFDKEVDVRAIMVYNSFDVETAFSKIDKVSISTMIDNNGKKFIGDAVITDLKFDEKHHIFVDKNDPEYRIMRPGGAAIAEFNEIRTKKITIAINSDKPIAISEIVVLGKEAK